MAKWFQTRKEDLPESIRELSPEDLDKALRDKKALEDSLTAKDTELNTLKTTVESQKTEFQTVKDKLAALEAGGGNREIKDEGSKGPASVFVNEDQAFADRIGTATGPLAAAAYGAGALAARMTAREAIQGAANGHIETKIWNKYANEINTLMAKEAPANQINPHSWINAFIYVKGMHFTDLQDLATKKTDVFAEVGSSSGAGSGGNGDENKDKLSPQELEIAKKFRMTPEKYLERKKAMKFVTA
jgi:hypothetical protein